MSKHLVCKTIICKVNGITILDLNNDIDNKMSPIDPNGDHCVDNDVTQSHTLPEDNHIDVSDGEDVIELSNDMSEQTMSSDVMSGTSNGQMNGKVLEIDKVENGIESVRQYVMTTRKNGKVWHQCQWQKGSVVCNYGSKWSGAMVNHIRSHLGVKPFRCNYCEKLFTIACNLKNHLRIHHNVRAKIVLNGGQRRRKSNPQNVSQEDESVIRSCGQSSKLRIFKPSFINGKVANNPYAPQRDRRYGSKRSLKRNQKYVDYTEDFDDDEEDKDEELIEEIDDNHPIDEDEAEEQNRLFYEKTKGENNDDTEEEEISKYIIKRRYNKISWFVCVWNPRQCKFRSQERTDVVNHIRKHQNLRNTINIDGQQLMSQQLIHKSFKCNFKGCHFETINERTLQMHKIRHKRR